jgi:hypothetical protein
MTYLPLRERINLMQGQCEFLRHGTYWRYTYMSFFRCTRQTVHLRCDTVFRPLPVRLPGRATTSIDAMPFDELSNFFAFRARRDAMLNSSDPQKSMRRGSHAFRPGADA